MMSLVRGTYQRGYPRSDVARCSAGPTWGRVIHLLVSQSNNSSPMPDTYELLDQGTPRHGDPSKHEAGDDPLDRTKCYALALEEWIDVVVQHWYLTVSRVPGEFRPTHSNDNCQGVARR